MAASVGVRAQSRRHVIDRLTWQDLANLTIEADDTPMHMAVLTILDGAGLAGKSAEEVLAEARANVAARIDRVPELRQVLYQGLPPSGRPVWVDDHDFVLEAHVLTAPVPAPGGEVELFAVTERLLERLLDRRRPLWELWVLTGLRHGRLALLLKVHHALTDGLGMLRIADALFEPAPSDRIPEARSWTPAPVPSWARLTASAGAQVASDVWGVGAALLHPIRLAASAAAVFTTAGSVTGRTWTGRRAPLRRPLGSHRRLGVLRLDLAAVKRVAHAHGAKVNDVVLQLAAGGIAGAVRSRGDTTDGMVLRGLMAVNPPAVDAVRGGNRAGAVLVSLPLGGAEGPERLRRIALDSRRARRWQRPSVVERFMVGVARTGMARFLSRHQGTVELAVSNLRGPARPIYFGGCRMVDAIPVTPISGNVTIDFCALSYAGRFNIAVLADAAAWPDLDVTLRAMRSTWAELRRSAGRAEAA